MNFLCILQVSRIVFVLKTKFYNHFSVFIILWTGRQFLGNAGVTLQTFLRLRTLFVVLRVDSRKAQGLLRKFPEAEGVSFNLSRSIRSPRFRLDELYNEPVRIWGHWI